MLKNAVKGLADRLGYDVIRKNEGEAQLSRGMLARFTTHGEDVAFLVLDEWDYIQRHHLKGGFYEPEELAIIGQHFDGGTFVDVGANVGNHSVYVLKFLGAERVVAFEPNPAAAELLAVNLALNGLSGRAEIRRNGLSDRQSEARIVAPRHKDLGSTRLALEAGEGASCRVLTGDAALADIGSISMIKIDTETMELAVLRGLERTLARCRPKLFVEVDDINKDAFLALAEERGYEVGATYKRYGNNCNYLLVPRN